ncbi:hypothetical protein FQN50_007914 [Emmonsiellopsis sp. PD_5]|nr:hypothetical protein FQN50_007914 [Emmonsiellopsis sp. PD_5]
MNNDQFRRLLFDGQSKKSQDQSTGKSTSPTSADAARTKSSALGSRMRSSIPMTPRSVTHVDFARQLAEHRRDSQPPPSKKFKSSAAPKGSKLAEGYQDRTLLRRQTGNDEDGDEGEKDELATRVQALEEMVKLGQIDQATFEKLRAEIGVGGDVKSTHLIKGLDWTLLRRVKAGEDVTAAPQREEGDDNKEVEVELDADAEFEKVLEEKEKTVNEPVAKKEEKVKKGTMAPPPNRKMTRDEILKQLKASRASQQPAAAAEPPPSALGDRFKKIGTKGEKKRWIEEDERGRQREVLLTTDSEGKTKRKVRWLDKPGEQGQKDANGGLLALDKAAKPLGMDVPAEVLARMKAAAPEEEEDVDIFEGVGRDYNPFGDMEEEDSSSSDESEGELKEKPLPSREDKDLPNADDSAKSPLPHTEPSKPRNYFSTPSTKDEQETTDRPKPFSTDPTIIAALKRAAAIRQKSPTDDEGAEEELSHDAALRRKKFLEEQKKRDREDAMDLDMGFGESRFGDEEDEEGIWEGDDSKAGNKRKRGPKKKKGDKDSVSDVMRVLEGRREGESKGSSVKKSG